MSDRESFIAAIAAAPDDDLPRLVYADWLDEHGEADRARFIRDQIALTKLRPGTDEYKTLFRRTADTLRANLPGWIQEACDAFGQPAEWKAGKAVGGRFGILLQYGSHHPLWRAEFSRGFVEHVTLRMSNTKRADELDELFRRHPITRLTAAHLPHPASEVLTPRMLSLRHLTIEIQPYPASAAAVFASPHLMNVTHLDLDSPDVLEQLPPSPLAKRLTHLYTRAATSMVAPLEQFPLDDRLQEFIIVRYSSVIRNDHYEMTPAFWSAVSRVAFRPTLKRLDLTRCGMTDDGLAAFARGEEWLRLQGLKLGGNLFGDRGWADFARGWRTPELTYLDASRNRLTDAGAVALARSGMIQTLRTIDLRGNRIGGRGAVALAEAVRRGPLRSLLLAGNPLKPRDVAAVRKALGERVDVGGV